MADDPGEDPIMSAFTPAAKKRQQRSEEQERIEAMVAEFQRQMAGMEQKLTELSMENDILVRKLQRKNDEETGENLDENDDDENDDENDDDEDDYLDETGDDGDGIRRQMLVV